MDIDTSGGKEMDRMIEIALNRSMMGGGGGGVVLKSKLLLDDKKYIKSRKNTETNIYI